MDDADRAGDRIEQVVSDGIQNAHRYVGLTPTGHCFYCSEPVQKGMVFCCPDCLKDWEWEQARKRVNGL